jgi:hypothetical protein
MDANNVYDHPNYRTLIEHHSKACSIAGEYTEGETDPLDPRNQSRLCAFLNYKLGEVNWLIKEDEEGDLIIQLVDSTLEFASNIRIETKICDAAKLRLQGRKNYDKGTTLYHKADSLCPEDSLDSDKCKEADKLYEEGKKFFHKGSEFFGDALDCRP